MTYGEDQINFPNKNNSNLFESQKVEIVEIHHPRAHVEKGSRFKKRKE